MALFELADLAALLQMDLDTSTATVVRNIVEAQVDEASGYRLADIDPASGQYATLSGIALQAAARLLDNPTGAVQETLGSWSVGYAPSVLTDEDRQRILRAVGVSGSRGPIGSVRMSIPPGMI